MPPPPFEQQITFLYAEDPAACRHFYGEVLGLTLVQDQGFAAIFATGGSRAFLGVVQARGPREARHPRHEGGVILTLVTPEVAAWHAHLAAAGVPIEAPPAQDATTGITHFFFRDPAGYLLEIQRFDRPGWPEPG
ncbi:VOC family protein [Belnapia sp. T6]|uniref:VOC family protein n=1 Tax=Belnapia mucosa TaxID=2804532 RepID=A0ABS1UY44_9PROT|nr:VOC family protein [Belnapia mucosa]MBL6454380.1 VOC family protein [Belnapia mucosa]